MANMKIKAGRSFLREMISLMEEKDNMTLEDVGGLLMRVSGNANTQISPPNHMIQQEIDRLATYITNAKKEIFSISTNNKAEAVLMDASQHLDEVIKATEAASNSIMDAADAIQHSANNVNEQEIQNILEATNRIYEACNFQDIAGQRITKVIKLLAHIEERISKLSALFGSNNLEATTENGQALTDKDLLNGPQLASQATSQADIDQILSSLGARN